MSRALKKHCFNSNGEFAWTPFDCRESISCVLCTHREDQRPSVREFVDLLRGHYNSSAVV